MKKTVSLIITILLILLAVWLFAKTLKFLIWTAVLLLVVYVGYRVLRR